MCKIKKWWNDPQRNMPIRSELKYFKKDLSEFDSPDLPGSGKENMNMDFVHRLDQQDHCLVFHSRSHLGFAQKNTIWTWEKEDITFQKHQNI